MARRAFFSFDFEHDIFRANQVRNSNVVLGIEEAGYYDHSEYEEIKRGSTTAIQRAILRHLRDTTVTVVLIGTRTAERLWVQYEIAESIKRNNGLVGIRIHHLAAPPLWIASLPGQIPVVWHPAEMPVYDWDPARVRDFAAVIEDAGKRADKLRREAMAGPPPLPSGMDQYPESLIDSLLPRPRPFDLMFPPPPPTVPPPPAVSKERSPVEEALAKLYLQGKLRSPTVPPPPAPPSEEMSPLRRAAAKLILENKLGPPAAAPSRERSPIDEAIARLILKKKLRG